MPGFDNTPTVPEKTTSEELSEAKQAEKDRVKEAEALNAKAAKDARPSGLDSFQEFQKENTEAELERLHSENPDSPAVRMSGQKYSPPNTVSGTQGASANFNREGLAVTTTDEEGKYDPHGGESEEVTEGNEPRERPE